MGTGEAKQYDVSDPFHPVETGSLRVGGIVSRQPHPSQPGVPLRALVHGLAMLVTSAVVAVVVDEVVGLRILRSAWANLDRVWAGAFVLAGVFVWFA